MMAEHRRNLPPAVDPAQLDLDQRCILKRYSMI
jgi:hypothetical protein